MSVLVDKRILVVEDEPLVSMLIEDAILDAGAVIVGPASSIEAALALIGSEVIDAASIDMNLNGRSAGPVAEALQTHAIPFAMVTGYGIDGVPQPFRERPIVNKPFEPARLVDTLAALLPAPR